MKESVRIFRFIVIGTMNALIMALVVWLMMKEIYTKPNTEIQEFSSANVIATSSNDIGKDDNIVDGSDGW